MQCAVTIPLSKFLVCAGARSWQILKMKRYRAIFSVLVLSLCSMCAESQSQSGAPGGQESTEDLQKATQNPVANLISVPLQNNTDEGIGPFARDRNTLNIQPVYPKQISEKWNLITRVILPVVFQPEINLPHTGTFGLGDTQPTFFFTPAKPSKLIWGVGPAFLLPTATDDELGSGKWSAGPSVLVLMQPGKFTIGALVSNLWSFAGASSRADVNTMNLQYFVNYNLQKGWFLTSSPIITANWNAGPGNIWLVPSGAGFGRIFKIGAQSFNASASLYYNSIRPDTLPSPKWQVRVQLAFLFPKAPKPAKSQ
jgi:hypothetical protein